MLLIALDRSSSTPLHRQIVERLVEAVEAGTVGPGERLPSTRRLARMCEVHRSTVALAYQQLWSLGYVELRQGARPRVRDRMAIAGMERAAGSGPEWTERATEVSGELLQWHRKRPFARGGDVDGVVSFARLDVDPRLYPVAAVRTRLARLVAESGHELLGYGDPAGYRPLRELLVRRLAQHGVVVTPEEVLLTNGSQHAIDLVLRVLTAPGDRVVVEAPTYDYLPPLLRLHRLEAVEVPLVAGGMDLDALEAALRDRSPKLVYTMPSFQNPAGVTTGQPHRERLLALCEAHGTPLLEDGYEEEMQYSGVTVLPIKSMDRKRLVAYCGTFSKALFPGLRVGWLVADRGLVERAAAVYRCTELSSPVLLQAVLAELCRDGIYDRHLARMHRTYRRRMAVLLEALAAHVAPEWAQWEPPQGGFLVWLRLRRCRRGSGRRPWRRSSPRIGWPQRRDGSSLLRQRTMSACACRSLPWRARRSRTVCGGWGVPWRRSTVTICEEARDGAVEDQPVRQRRSAGAR